MSLETNTKFENIYLNETDNVFEAINNWSADAKHLYSAANGRLSEKECLTACLDKKLPEDFSKRIPVKYSDNVYEKRYIDEVLKYVYDTSIHMSIRLSISNSKCRRNLIFTYDPNLSEGQKTRIRIICRMIWSNLFGRRI